MDWHWAIRTKSCLVRSLEESDQSSSTQSDVTGGKTMEQLNFTWKFYLRKIFTNISLVWWSLESLFGCRRRIRTKISVLFWYFGNNYLSPCSSRTFWKQSHWSNVTRQFGDWDWNIQLHLPHWMRIQSSFYYQQWIDTWRSRFEQKTDSILLAHWSKRRKSQRCWTYWLPCTTPSAIRAQCMEKAPRRGILGWFWSCDQRRINILSNTTDCNYSSRNTSSLLHSKSWRIENWRSLVWKTLFVYSTTTKDLIETRSQLDQKEWSIGFYSWTTASWKTRSTFFWRSTTC